MSFLLNALFRKSPTSNGNSPEPGGFAAATQESPHLPGNSASRYLSSEGQPAENEHDDCEGDDMGAETQTPFANMMTQEEIYEGRNSYDHAILPHRLKDPPTQIGDPYENGDANNSTTILHDENVYANTADAIEYPTSTTNISSKKPAPRSPLGLKPAPAITTKGMTRSRSLSRNFPAIAAELPSMMEIKTDVLEYLCHILVLDTMPLPPHHDQQVDEAQPRSGREGRALESFHEYRQWLSATTFPLPDHGRLYSRLQLTALVVDLHTTYRMPPSLPQWSPTESAVTPYSSTAGLTADAWFVLREHLILLKNIMSRRDANFDSSPWTTDPMPTDSTLDAELDKHEMMQGQFREALLLLQVQEALAWLRQELRNLYHRFSQLSQPGLADQATDGQSNPVTKAVERAVDGYQQRLRTAFGQVLIPNELNSFVLSELYGRNIPVNAMVTHLLEHIDKVVLDPLHQYSHAYVNHKIRALVTKWAESILDIPKLIQLGYGGVCPPVVGQDDDDVSSWGVDEVEGVQGTQRTEQHVARKVSSETRRARFSVTEDDREIIARLGLPKKAPRTALSVVSVAKHVNRPEADAGKEQSFLTQGLGEVVTAAAGDVVEEHSLEDSKPAARNIRQTPLREPREGGYVCSADDDDDETEDPDEQNRNHRSREWVSQPPISVLRNASGHKKPNQRVQPSQSRNPTPRAWPSPAKTKMGMVVSRAISPPKQRVRKREWYESDSDDIFDDNVTEFSPSVRKKRRPFTKEEEKAIREGVVLFGKGKWKDIQQNDPRLRHRDPVQIKDKYRNMEKQQGKRRRST